MNDKKSCLNCINHIKTVSFCQSLKCTDFSAWKLDITAKTNISNPIKTLLKIIENE